MKIKKNATHTHHSKRPQHKNLYSTIHHKLFINYQQRDNLWEIICILPGLRWNKNMWTKTLRDLEVSFRIFKRSEKRPRMFALKVTLILWSTILPLRCASIWIRVLSDIQSILWHRWKREVNSLAMINDDIGTYTFNWDKKNNNNYNRNTGPTISTDKYSDLLSDLTRIPVQSII